MRRLIPLAFALGVASCQLPFTSSPTPRPATTAPGALGTAGPAREVSFPDCDSRRVAGSLPACNLAQVAMDRGVFVGILQRYADGILSFEARAIDLGTGETRVIRSRQEEELVIEDVRDDVVLLRDVEDFGGGDVHVLLLRVPWRDPARTEILDEVDLTVAGGGASWNPWPHARTNGRDVVWLRGGDPLTPHELVLLRENGAAQVVGETDRPVHFDIDEAGRVVFATLASIGTKQDLQVYDGRLRTLGSRTADASSEVAVFGTLIGWPVGAGLRGPVAEIEILPLAGGASKRLGPEPSCVIVGWTARDIVTVCPPGVRLIDVASGAARDGPASRLVLAFRRGILWRTAADLAASPDVWRLTVL